MPTYLQRLLELVNTPPAVSNPSTMRPPRAAQFKGLVFEYVKGDTTETVSFINEPLQADDNGQRLSWQATNTAFCPKS